jgi:hypothetical protein
MTPRILTLGSRWRWAVKFTSWQLQPTGKESTVIISWIGGWVGPRVGLDTGKKVNFFVGFEVLTAVVMKSAIFWDITPCTPLSVNRCFEGTYHLHLQGWENWFSKKPAWKQVASCWTFFTLKMEAICSSETSVDTQRTTRRYISEDGTLQVNFLSLPGI